MTMFEGDTEVFVATMLRGEGDTGVQTHVNTLIRYLRQRGMTVHLINPFTPWRNFRFTAIGIGKLVRVVNGPLWVRCRDRIYLMILRYHLLKRLPFDRRSVVYAQCPISAFAALEARVDGRTVDVVLVVHFNVSQADEWIQAGYIPAGGEQAASIRRFEEDVLRRVDRLIFPSRFMMEQITERLGVIEADRSFCIPSFVEAPQSNRRPRRMADLITVGTLEPRKNHVFLIRMLAEAHRLGSRYRLTIVGDGPLRRMLEGEVLRLDLDESVEFTGFVSNAARLMTSHRAYVHSALMENLPISLIEAIAAGLPVFAAPVGGIPEIVRNEVEGVWWALDDPLDAARKLIRVLNDDERYSDMSRSARSRYLDHFATDVVAPRLLNAIMGGTTDDSNRGEQLC
jgi:glycosyltransferase involved in cell wall biosynthesis